MNIPVLVLLGFAAWTLVILSVGVGGYRWALILSGRASVAGWRADAPQGADWYQRVMRAHMNCVENLPVYGAIVGGADGRGLAEPFHRRALRDHAGRADRADIGSRRAAPDQRRRERPLHAVFHPADLHVRHGGCRRGSADRLIRTAGLRTTQSLEVARVERDAREDGSQCQMRPTINGL